MRKYLFLVGLVTLLIMSDRLLGFYGFELTCLLHTILFFGVQTLVLFRIEDLLDEERRVLASLLKITVRLLSALVFLLAIVYSQQAVNNGFYIQFIILYLVFLIFENGLALANLRRN